MTEQDGSTIGGSPVHPGWMTVDGPAVMLVREYQYGGAVHAKPRLAAVPVTIAQVTKRFIKATGGHSFGPTADTDKFGHEYYTDGAANRLVAPDHPAIAKVEKTYPPAT